MKKKIIYLIIIVVITVNIFAQTNNLDYTSKYNISEFDFVELKKYFDVGWAWREETITQDGNPATRIYSIRMNHLKWARARYKLKQIKSEIKMKFDSVLDKCYARINNITNKAGKPVGSIKTGLRTYIEKLKIKPDGTSEKDVKIIFKFDDMYLNYYNLNRFNQIQHAGQDGQTRTYNVGVGNLDTWTWDKGVSGGTPGDGVIIINNGYKDFQVRTFTANVIDRANHNSCKYEITLSYLRDSNWLSIFNSRGLTAGPLKTASFEIILAHEVIHNALRQEAPGDYWKDKITGRWYLSSLARFL